MRLDPTVLFTAIIESSDDAIVSKDLNGIVTSWNPAAERMFGYTAEEMIGRSIRTIIPAERQGEEDEVLARIRRGDRVDHFETMRQRKDGTRIPISLTVSPVRNELGNVVGASKIARDISDRKRADMLTERLNLQTVLLAQVTTALTRSLDSAQTLRTLATLVVPHIADWCAIDVFDDQGQITRLTVAHKDPARATTAERMAEQPNAWIPPAPDSVIRTGVPALMPCVSEEANGHDDPVWPGVVHSLGFVSYMCVPLRSGSRVIGAISFVTAESRREYSEQDLRFAEDLAARASLAYENSRAYEQLQTANQLKDEFLATLSHELRTPLNAVLGYARLVRAGAIAADRLTDALAVIERNASALTQIVEDVLDVSRIITGKTRLHVQPLELGTVLHEAVATVRPAADAKGIHIDSLIDSEAGPVSGDADRLQQVVWNLLSNAVKFTPRGGRVQLQLRRIDSHVEIEISDNGIGIPPAFLQHIFERFRQAEAGTSRRHGGLGLGLAIARHLVEMHGGTIQAFSEGEGKGSTFRILLPLRIAQAPTAETRSPDGRAPERQPFAANLRGIHVLAVDDDEDSLRLVRDILEQAGARVTTASGALAALEKLETTRPDVLVADLGMPVVDGFDLIRRVRQAESSSLHRIPAAALTAYARSTDRTKALRSGFEMHLAKPIHPTELVAVVEALARRRTSST
jgi:PAS domain S-box-containing protein